MTPTPPDSGSPLATLRQLKEMLDAGTLTPQEFEALKQRLIFGSLASGLPDVGTVADREAGPHTEPVEVPFVPPAGPPSAASHPSEYLDTPGALTPEATPLLTPEPDWLAAPSSSPFAADAEMAAAFETPAEATERRNPLNLLFAIGGLLLFLAVVGYLALGHRTAGPDEHLTSTSQTAADSTAAAPEVGPQAEQLTLPPAAAPETIRVAPAVAPALPADSAAVPAAAVPTATPMPAAPAPKPAAPKGAAPKPAAAPAPADTAGSRP